MHSDQLLTDVLTLEVSLVALTLATLIAATAIRQQRRRTADAHLPAARIAVARVLDGSADPRDGHDALARLPMHMRVGLVADAGVAVNGAGRRRLAAIAYEAGLIDDAEASCMSRHWWRRLRGLRLFTLAGAYSPTHAGLLADPHEEVRAAAAMWASHSPEPEIIDRLVAMLDDQRRICRSAAKSALLRMGGPVVEPLARRLSSSPAGRIEEAMEVAVGIAEAALLPAALDHGHDPSPRLRALAAAVGGAVGGGPATDMLTAMLGDEDSGVRVAATAALGGLAHWPAAPQLAAALRDREWEVRQASALALRAIGPVGLVLLRECLDDADAFARDMAQQVLERPSRPERAPSS